MHIDPLQMGGLSPAERADALLTTPEGQWFERKSARSGLDVIARSVIGFANAEGGVVAVGLSDGRVEDMAARGGHANAVRRVPRTHCAPPPRVRCHEVDVAQGEHTGSVLLLEVAPGETLHETPGGECFLRVGDSTVKLNAAQREELAYDRGAAQYEARSMPGVALSDLGERHLTALRAALATVNPTTQMLSARSLLTPQGTVTVAAYLLLADEPGLLMPHAHVRVLRYLSPHEGSGARQSLADDGDARIEGPIPQVIAEATQQIDAWLPRRRALQSDGRFGPVPVVPRDAWLEGLVNAVVHRSYSMAGDHIRVALFPDRVEIESPGRFPGLVDLGHPLDINRYARNPRIARVCHDLGFTQEKGEGIRRIIEEMRARDLADPIYKQTAGSVRLTLLGTHRLRAEQTAALPAGAAKALAVLRRVGRPMGTGEVAMATGLQRPATIRALRTLRDLGEIEWHGTTATDPRATWSLPSGLTP